MDERVVYTPRLRLLPAEKRALAQVAPPLRSRMEPMFVAEPVGDETIAEWLQKALKGFREAVPPGSTASLDWAAVGRLPEAADRLFEAAKAHGCGVIPAVAPEWISAPARSEHRDILKRHSGHGIAFRVEHKLVQQNRLEASLDAALKSTAVPPEQADLVLDLGDLADAIDSFVLKRARDLLTAAARPWRSVTLAGCAFPQSLAGLVPDMPTAFERTDWATWSRVRGESARVLRFGDVGIHHPKGAVPQDTEKAKAIQWSPNIRFTSGDRWICLKGHGHRVRAPSEQLPKMARRFVSGELAPFPGASHCAGCQDISRMTASAKGQASALACRRISFVHHFTTVVQQLTNPAR